jgi:RNAse (barnase) inhibitor barstar
VWSYLKAWERSASILGVEIEGPFRIELPASPPLEAELLVRGFGAPNGTLVVSRHESYRDHLNSLRERGYTVSSFGPYAPGVECSLQEAVEVLGDWGWCGAGIAPDWLITLDARGWSRPEDFFGALLPCLQSPEWHGYNLNALWDSLVVGSINGLNPPIALRLFNTADLNRETADLIQGVVDLFRRAKKEGVPVAIFVWP